MIPKNGQARHSWSVASRVVAGTLGAYGLTSLFTIALSLLLVHAGMDRVEAVTTATLISFAIFAIIAMAVFHAHSARRAWMWLALTALPMAFTSWMLIEGGAL